MSGRGKPSWREPMQRLDAELQTRVGAPLSLAPGRARAQSLSLVAEELLASRSSPWQQAFVAASVDITEAMLEHFPGNLYWDLDYVMAALLAEAGCEDEGPQRLRQLAAMVVALQVRFGRHGLIRFRYLHDFTYGFDWARWVARKPAQRAGHGPFSLVYLRHIEGRGREMSAAIEAGDPALPLLAPGQFRNPFPFSREPVHEARLLADLAGRDLIPVHAWCTTAQPRHDLPFAALREERAWALAIPPAAGDGEPALAVALPADRGSTSR